MIVLKGIDYECPEMIDLATEFGKAFNGEVVHLPKFLSFDNIDPKYPQIVRIGSLNMDGSIKPSNADAIMWH